MLIDSLHISFDSFSFESILPMLVLVCGGIFTLLINAFTSRFSRNLNVFLCMLFLVLDFLVVLGLEEQENAFFGFLSLDTLSLISQSIVLISAFFLIFLALSKERFNEFQTAEFYSLYLFIVAGFQFMVSSNHLLLILIGLETASLPLCVLMALSDKRYGLEAGIKYFTMGAMASAFFAMGAMAFYLLTGSLNLEVITLYLHTEGITNPMLFAMGAIFLIGAIGFKVSLVPFHTWMPDVYEGNNPVFASYISIVPKIAGFVVATRLFGAFIDTHTAWVEDIFYVLILMTITIPNFIALWQEDVKRMLAYSSISHSGFALACVFIHTQDSQQAMFVYWFMFAFTYIGAFGLLWLLKSREKTWDERYDHPYSKFNGLIKTHPLVAILGAIFVFGLAGIPPFSVFWGKFLAVESALESNHTLLAVVMLVNSAVAAFYYFRWLVAMFFNKPLQTQSYAQNDIYTQNATMPIYAVVIAMALACLFSVFMMRGLLEFVA
ncbi:NADH-quinone oxidoreductase subunit NuoN [Helicobacter pylori]|uniref:NADH-quinone oxidoreductase subunit NuoN n=1 Tax=Helicobacter pylori TaxID=210 RepID=UPI0012E94960|nr:NADH-quinone oxidoreductase subunit NuoN [Helicobacter pylori]MUU32255.1 NADH-quinone oxidoreductase subunit NuoN [Helicobacter pylori]